MAGITTTGTLTLYYSALHIITSHFCFTFSYYYLLYFILLLKLFINVIFAATCFLHMFTLYCIVAVEEPSLRIVLLCTCVQKDVIK